jgi:hypothetical protein
MMVAGCLFALISCSDEDIHVTPVNFVDPKVIAGDSAKIDNFVSNLYSLLPNGYNRLSSSSMIASSTDEAVHSVLGSAAQRWGEGNWDPNYIQDNPFANLYMGIRRSFIFEETILPIVKNEVVSPSGREWFLAQARFLRAFYNAELLRRWGGYPLIKRSLSADEDLNFPRNTYDECVDYIVGLCDEAAGVLPVSYANAQLGRVTKGSALALKARVLLYAASPLFNDSSKPDDHPERGRYDPAKWERAADAAAAVINLKDNNNNAVHALFGNYANLYITNNADYHKEAMLVKMRANGNDIERLNGPVSITNGEGGTCPTLDLVNDYEMIDGTAFDWNNPAHAADPFAGRDPRFALNILYNGASWMNNMTIETFEGGKDKVGNRATRTSFYLCKFLNVNARWTGTTGTSPHLFPLIRYAEILLDYAEAMNEAYGPDVDPRNYGMTARDAVQLIRARAGLTANRDLSLNVAVGDRTEMREAIRHERRIELAFEEHRHYDVRRWKIAEDVFNRPVSGLKITKREDGSFSFTPETLESRVFTSRMYLWPFPQSEINKNPELIQNTGW